MFGISGKLILLLNLKSLLSRVLAGAVGDVGNAGGVAGVFQVVWKGAGSSRLSIRRQLP